MNPKRIWKYTLELTAAQHVRMPRHAEPIAVAMQGDELVMWAIVHLCPDGKTVARKILVAGTGHPSFAEEMTPFGHIGTVQDGALVWHVFDGGEQNS